MQLRLVVQLSLWAMLMERRQRQRSMTTNPLAANIGLSGFVSIPPSYFSVIIPNRCSSSSICCSHHGCGERDRAAGDVLVPHAVALLLPLEPPRWWMNMSGAALS